MKRCTKCDELKPFELYHKSTKFKDGLFNWCKNCRKEYDAARYNRLGPKDWKRTRSDSGRIARRKWFLKFKHTLSCQACPETHHACLDFHHRNPSEKVDSISSMIVRGLSIKTILLEIEKCDVLCSNCHRKIHYNENL
jgi:hypothetical protein